MTKKDTKFKKGHEPWNKGKTGVYSKEVLARMSKANKGRESWCKGMKGITLNTGKTHFKKGQAPWNKGKKAIYSNKTLEKMSKAKRGKPSGRKGKRFPGQLGEGTANWAGDEVSYSGLHYWVMRHLGNPDTCEHCGKSGLSGHEIHWANKDHKYKRNLKDWLRLCAKCHKEYDKKQGHNY